MDLPHKKDNNDGLASTYRFCVEDDNFYKDDVDKMLDGVTSIYTVYLKI